MIGDFCFTKIGRSDIRDQTVRFLRVWLPKVSMVTFPTSPQNLKRSEGFRDPTFWVCIPTENVDFFFSFFPPFASLEFSVFTQLRIPVLCFWQIYWTQPCFPNMYRGGEREVSGTGGLPLTLHFLLFHCARLESCPIEWFFFLFLFFWRARWFSETYFPLVVV